MQQNQVLQQQVQQQQIATKQAQDIQGALGDLQNYKTPNGGFDYNAWMSQSVAPKYPLAVRTGFDIRNKNIGSLVTGTTDAQGNPVARTPENIALGSGNNAAPSTNGQQPPAGNSQSSPNSSSGVFPAGLPADPLNLRVYYAQKQAAYDSAKKDVAPLENVYDILKKNPDDQGTALGALNTYFAQHNIPMANNAAEAIQLTKDHAAQLQVNTDSPTDKARFDQEMANLNPNDLGGSLKRMIPYLIGTREMAQDQGKYLKNQEPNGIDPVKIGNARATLQPISDPRVYELNWLKKNDPSAYKARLSGLSTPELTELSDISDQVNKLNNPQQAQ